MSRPSRREARRLETLEGASALLDEAMCACGVAAVRLRQARRQQPHLADMLEPIGDELSVIVDSCDDAHRLIKRRLAEEQERRRT